MLENDHYYLIVFDFKKSECVIIDNIYSEESIEVIYGNVPNDLVRKFHFNLPYP